MKYIKIKEKLQHLSISRTHKKKENRKGWMDREAAEQLMTLYDEMLYFDPVIEWRIYLKNGLR